MELPQVTPEVTPGLMRWLLCPSLVRHKNISVVVEQPCPTMIRFTVDNQEWNTYMHSYDFNRRFGTVVQDGWIRVHYNPGTECEVALCHCMDEDHAETYYHYDYSITLKCVEKLFLDHYEKRGTFPDLPEIRESLRPVVQIIKSIRAYNRTNEEVLQDAKDAIYLEWNSVVHEYMHRVKTLCKKVPLGTVCVSRVGNALIDRYYLEYQFDLTFLREQLDRLYSFLHAMQVDLCKNPKGGSEKRSELVWKSLPKEQVVLEALYGLFEVLEIPEIPDLKDLALLEAMYQVYRQRQVWLFMLSLGVRLRRWRWNSVRNQNHPSVLKARGRFGDLTQVVDLRC